MGWKYKAGLFLIGTVVFIWVTSAEVTQDIFTAYKQPFAVTYLGASLMIVYLPIAFLKDRLCRYLDRRRSARSIKLPNESSVEIGSPLRHKIIEMGLQGTITKKDSEEDFSSHEEDVRPLIGRGKEETHTLKHGKDITTKQIAIIYPMLLLLVQAWQALLYCLQPQGCLLFSLVHYWAKTL